ncbi:heme/hemin ABC transporter substrate-binding protein [Pseudoalteromonas sp.]|uniref:heme/hemin ABC transporter substrate-binding protein n=1 Tax=unclassified Pseudoalteromonas TaxID=194690 RepID=UPI003F944BE3
MKPFVLLLISLVVILFSRCVHASPQPINPQRIVVAGGSITEVIYALGEQQRIVGVDSSSIFPAAATTQPQIGYVRKISVEGILSLNPDLILAEADIGPKKVVEQLKRTAANLVILHENDSFWRIENKIEQIASLLQVQSKGTELAQALKADRDALTHILKQATTKPKVLVIRSDQLMVAGSGTTANELVAIAGGKNVMASSVANWQAISSEAALVLNPDVIITMSIGGHEQPSSSELLNAFKFSNAVKNKRVHNFDVAYLLSMGPRTPQALVELAHTFYPQAQLPDGYQYRF